jgi:hypothetical protein
VIHETSFPAEESEADPVATPTHVIDDMVFESYIGPGATLYNFRTPLNAFDGANIFARLLAKLPHPGWSDDFTPDEIESAKRTYTQAGGSAARMTVEVRKETADHGFQVFAIGHRPAADVSQPPAELIQIGANTSLVYPNEIFTAEEAAELFFHYYKNDDVPESYVLRELTLEGYDNS